MSSTLTKMLEFLPTCFNISPQAISAFTINYDDADARLKYTVQDNVISGKRFSSFSNDFEIDLEGKTIQEVADEINDIYNYTTVVFGDGTMSAMRLMEADNSRDSMVYSFTSPTWALIKALAIELKEAHTMKEEALRMMNVQGSEGIITDYWCGFLNSTRNTGEGDAAFGQRAINEVKLPKSNNVAMSKILFKYYGYDIEVIDLIFTQTARMDMNSASTPLHNTQYPIADSTSISIEPGVFGIIMPDNTISTWGTEEVAELRVLVHAVKEAGTRCKVFWKDLPAESWMYMNNTTTPVHDTDYILPFTKTTDFFTIYL